MGRLNEQFPFEWSITGQDIDFESLVLGLKSPALCSKASGSINLDANLVGDLVAGVDQAAISMNSEWLLVDDFPIRGVRLKGDYSPAGIQVEMEAEEFAGGSLAGSSKWRSLDELGRIVPSQAHFKINQLDLRQLTRLAAMEDIGFGGLATGSLTVGTEPRPPLDQWETSGSLNIVALELSGVQLGSTAMRWNKELVSRQLLSTISLEQEGGRLESGLVVRLQDREDGSLAANQFLDYTMTGQLTDYRITAQLGETRSRRLSGRIAGSFEIGGRPDYWMRQGQAELSRSEVAVETLQFALESAELDFDEEEIRLKRFKVDGSAGRLDGDATWKRNRLGQHRLRLRLDKRTTSSSDRGRVGRLAGDPITETAERYRESGYPACQGCFRRRTAGAMAGKLAGGLVGGGVSSTTAGAAGFPRAGCRSSRERQRGWAIAGRRDRRVVDLASVVGRWTRASRWPASGDADSTQTGTGGSSGQAAAIPWNRPATAGESIDQAEFIR